MELGATTVELVELVVALALSGVITGLLAGLFGVGGGAVMIPVLYEAYAILGVDDSIRMHICIGTAMAVIVPTAIRSCLAHYRRGSVDMAVVRSWLVPMPVGVALAAILAAALSGAALSGVFAAIAALVAFRLLFGRDSWRLGADLPANPLRAAIGVVIGFLSTLMGVGGGIMVNTVMMLYGRPMIQAVGTSSAVGPIIAVPAVIGYIWARLGCRRFAAAVGRLCQPSRLHRAGSRERAGRALWRASRPRHVGTQARDRLRTVPVDCLGALLSCLALTGLAPRPVAHGNRRWLRAAYGLRISRLPLIA